MKNKLSISIIFLIVFCYCSNNSSELPTRKQKMYTPITTPLSKKDAEQAQQTIVQLAKDLGKAGELNLDDVLANSEMIE